MKSLDVDECKELRDQLQERCGVPLEFGDGWLQLFSDMLDEMDGVGIEYVITRAKEKWGVLRIYFRLGDDFTMVDAYGDYKEIERIVEDAEKKSSQVCEVCGEAGETEGFGWLKTLCSEHRAEWNDEHSDFIDATKRNFSVRRAKLDALGAIPESDYRETAGGIRYVTFSDVRSHHSDDAAEKLSSWMHGQTGVFVSENDGEDTFGVYIDDYERWIRQDMPDTIET